MHLHKMQATNNGVNLIILLPILLLVIPCTPIARAADPLFIICIPTQNYTSNSSFESNLLLLLKSITSNTSLSGGFYNTSFGSNEDDSVYGLALCRGDVMPEVCQNCVINASRGIVEQCPSGKQATISYEFCQVRYSDQNFFSMMVHAVKYPNWNNTKQDILDPDQYTLILNDLMTNISNRAAFDSSGNMFATDEASLTSTGRKLYGLGQCTRDISRDDCYKCLRGEVGDIVGCCSSYEGGIVVDNSCNLRYELYRFYRVEVVPASPQPPPSTTSTRSKDFVYFFFNPI
ncbi:Gnk2-homologous domain [Macleaya cordata]|uniref:Gnk2-homologous domain n=1 Tax=Macleaya cordata TaxID=56857 RepID=A0A200QRS8_MACCD|nr:Gnk2-homologous domain [Macleaya cordata]